MMSDEELRTTVLNAIASVAPEANLSELGPTVDIRDALDIDSMDFLRVVVALHDRLHVDIPERDYVKIRTLDGCVGYLKAKLAL